jgi:hypothetical protein
VFKGWRELYHGLACEASTWWVGRMILPLFFLNLSALDTVKSRQEINLLNFHFIPPLICFDKKTHCLLIKLLTYLLFFKNKLARLSQPQQLF